MQALSHLAAKGLSTYVTVLNDSLCKRLAAGRFAATTFLLHDPHRETMEVICAGQFEPWRWHNDKWEPVPVPHALALGIFAGQQFSVTEVPCQPGEKWLLFSDGINEGRSRGGEEFGSTRLLESLDSGHAANVLAKTWASWENFVDGENLHDDACLALIQTLPEPSMEITSAAGNCKIARHFIESWALTAGYPDLERGRIVLATDEATTNIIRHTYQNAPDRPIILSASINEGLFHLRLRDYGPPIDACMLKGRDLDDVKPGGLGLHLLKSVFTIVEHIPLPDGNELHLAKPLA
jgi:anti-sigma regulatory factor (Ser/Thr protein kinase)